MTASTCQRRTASARRFSTVASSNCLAAGRRSSASAASRAPSCPRRSKTIPQLRFGRLRPLLKVLPPGFEVRVGAVGQHSGDGVFGRVAAQRGVDLGLDRLPIAAERLGLGVLPGPVAEFFFASHADLVEQLAATTLEPPQHRVELGPSPAELPRLPAELVPPLQEPLLLADGFAQLAQQLDRVAGHGDHARIGGQLLDAIAEAVEFAPACFEFFAAPRKPPGQLGQVVRAAATGEPVWWTGFRAARPTRGPRATVAAPS